MTGGPAADPPASSFTAVSILTVAVATATHGPSRDAEAVAGAALLGADLHLLDRLDAGTVALRPRAPGRLSGSR